MIIISFDNSNLSIVLTIIGIVLTIIGVILTAISIRKQRPKYTILSETIREKDFTDSTFLKIYSKGQEVPSLTISKVAIWNTGKMLEPSDIVKDFPICIKTTNKNYNVRILDVQEIYSDDKNGIKKNNDLSKEGESIVFDFDFLRNNQGFVLKVFHTGDRPDLNVEGSLKNGKDIKYVPPTPKKTGWIFVAAGTGAMSMVVTLFPYIIQLSDLKELQIPYSVWWLLVLFPYFVFLIMGIRMLKDAVPKCISCWLFEEEQRETKFRLYFKKLFR